MTDTDDLSAGLWVCRRPVLKTCLLISGYINDLYWRLVCWSLSTPMTGIEDLSAGLRYVWCASVFDYWLELELLKLWMNRKWQLLCLWCLQIGIHSCAHAYLHQLAKCLMMIKSLKTMFCSPASLLQAKFGWM